MKKLILLIALLFSTNTYALPALSSSDEQVQKTTEYGIVKTIKKEILKANMYINKNLPKYMKKMKESPTISNILLLCLAGFIYGIIHTIGPGHGKMVVATYFLSADKPKIINGVMLGTKMAIFHVGGDVVLVILSQVLLFNFIQNQHEQIYYLKLLSYSLIFLLGIYMLYIAIVNMKNKTEKSCMVCARHGHSHDHNHDHSHDHKHNKQESFTAFVIGFVPCTGSLLILLYAIAHHILHLGLLIVAFVALGMALTMILIGLLCILGKNKIINKLETKTTKLKYLEPIGAIFIILIGVSMFYFTV